MKKVNWGMFTVVAAVFGTALWIVTQLFVCMLAMCEVSQCFKIHNYEFTE